MTPLAQELPNAMVVGWNETWFLGSGWYSPAEGPNKIQGRWCALEAYVSVPSGPWTHLEVIMIGRSVQGNPVGLGVYAGAKKLGWIATQNGDRFEIASLKVLNQGERFSENEIRFVCEFNNDHADQPATFIPNQTLNNGDYRELGLFIAGMRFR